MRVHLSLSRGSIVLAGKHSVGGMINDPRSIGDTWKKEANLTTITDWDNESNTPQIVLMAVRDIKKGEELLYDYGNSYWKVMWKNMMLSHAEYAVRTEAENSVLEAALQVAPMSDGISSGSSSSIDSSSSSSSSDEDYEEI